MGNWNAWGQAYDRLTLAAEGDPMERAYAMSHNLGAVFPNYQVFWRHHVTPATNRPVNIHHRPGAAPEICSMMTLSHSVLSDLYDSLIALTALRRFDYGDRLKNFKDFLKSAGDSLQKFTDLQKAVLKGIGRLMNPQLPTPLNFWSDPDWDSIWGPRREDIVNYRNYLTHAASLPWIAHTQEPDKTYRYYAIRRQHLMRGNQPTWNDQKALYEKDPAQFAELGIVCQELYDDTACWLNDVYAQMIK